MEQNRRADIIRKNSFGHLSFLTRCFNTAIGLLTFAKSKIFQNTSESKQFFRYERHCQKSTFGHVHSAKIQISPHIYALSLIKNFSKHILDSQGCKVSSCKWAPMIVKVPLNMYTKWRRSPVHSDSLIRIFTWCILDSHECKVSS